MSHRALLAAWTCVSVLALVPATHAEDPAPRVVSVKLPAASSVVKAQTGADGAVHVLFDTADGPRYARSKDGVAFGAAIEVVDAASRKKGLEFHGWDLAVGRDGSVHAALGTNAWKLKLPKDEWSLRYGVLAPGAKAFSAVRNLNKTSSEGFALAADAKGGVAATFLAGSLYAMTSRDDGAKFTPAAEIDPAWNPCDCCTTSAAFGPDGRFAVLYREETGNERDMYVAICDPSGAKKPVRSKVSTTPWKINACPMTYFSIARTATGYVAAWPTKGDVYFAHLDSNGALVAPGEIRTSGAAGMRTGVFAVSAADGATLVAWKKDGVLGWQLYDAKGAAEGAAGTAPSPGAGAAAAVLADGRFAVFP